MKMSNAFCCQFYGNALHDEYEQSRATHFRQFNYSQKVIELA